VYKIKAVHIYNHPILGTIDLDFTGPDGNAVDTVILAGENGIGKSTILNLLYTVFSRTIDIFEGLDLSVELETPEGNVKLTYSNGRINTNDNYIFVNDGTGKRFINNDAVKQKYPFKAIFSDVDINFHSSQLSSVTSLDLDKEERSRRSTEDLPTRINQLIIDVQSLDDADVAYSVRNNPDANYQQLSVAERIPRFIRAFDRMFDDLSYDRIVNTKGHKGILFKRNGVSISINNLSSGEKQVVYRGCFLLKDVNATNGAFIFIDEPEISLHPRWQMKILDYYKDIFTATSGEQTLQLIVATHSPFIIHNDNRHDDKVIVLKRSSGNISIETKPEYFRCDSIAAVEDAFLTRLFKADGPKIYVEGRTDEKYLNTAAQLFNPDTQLVFKWVGYLDSNKKERNTGSSGLNNAREFLVMSRPPFKVACLFDSDTHRSCMQEDNVLTLFLPQFKSSTNIKKGIENTLVLDNINLDDFYEIKTRDTGYGKPITIPELQKMKLCDYLCGLPESQKKAVFCNLRPTITDLENFLMIVRGTRTLLQNG
jgi:predicted ATPase